MKKILSFEIVDLNSVGAMGNACNNCSTGL